MHHDLYLWPVKYVSQAQMDAVYETARRFADGQDHSVTVVNPGGDPLEPWDAKCEALVVEFKQPLTHERALAFTREVGLLVCEVTTDYRTLTVSKIGFLVTDAPEVFAVGRRRCPVCDLTLAGGCVCARLTPEQRALRQLILAMLPQPVGKSVMPRLSARLLEGLTRDQLEQARAAAPEETIEKVLSSMKHIRVLCGIEAKSLLARMHDLWTHGTFPFAIAGRELKRLKQQGEYSDDDIVTAFARYLEDTPEQFLSIPRFCNTYARWAGQKSMTSGHTRVDRF